VLGGIDAPARKSSAVTAAAASAASRHHIAFVYNGPKGMELAPKFLTHIIVEAAKAVGGSFKLVTAVPKPVREMTQLLRETQKDGDIQTNQRNTNEQRQKQRH